jgi:hypothetical protein
VGERLPAIPSRRDLHDVQRRSDRGPVGVGDLAILDREASFIEVDAYQQGTGYDPFSIPVARGSVAIQHHAPALIVYVNASNPPTHL